MQSGEPRTDRILIKYRNQNNVVIASASDLTVRAARVGKRVGTALAHLRTIHGGVQVAALGRMRGLSEVTALAKQIMADAEVEYAEPDVMLQPTFVPNEPAFGFQWSLGTGAGGIGAARAWDLSTGNNVVVAVLDSGITAHPELDARRVGGYDFISNDSVNGVARSYTANDGDGRDANPADPGDWITQEESDGTTQEGFFAGCAVGNSVWHGTHVAGIVGAATNNGTGMAGVAFNARIVPVRVLGKCGGYTSDIADAVRWAAGDTVTGVPANANPARVLNLSLGGPSPCSTTMQNAVNAARARGAVIVAAAANDADDANLYQPGNCAGVINVGATDINGHLASYSNFGTSVSLMAPGGDFDPLDDTNPAPQVLSTVNTGTTTPLASTLVSYSGTSMAAPHVAGVAALVRSLNPNLTPDNVRTVLRNSARILPASSGCTTTTCGTGMLNAEAAVLAARPVVPNIAPDLTTLKRVRMGSKTLVQMTYSGAGSTAAVGSTVRAYSWKITNGTATISSGATTSKPATSWMIGCSTGRQVTYRATLQLTATNSFNVSATTSYEMTASSDQCP